MTDRELLEFAAKAAGIDWFDEPAAKQGRGLHLKSGRFWNPIADDGDALRLFLTIRGELHTVDDMNTPTLNSVYISRGGQLHREWLRDHDNNPYAATRRAIVRAAAEIGRSMA